MQECKRAAVVAIVLVSVSVIAAAKLPHKNYKFVNVQVPGAVSTTIQGIDDLGDMVGTFTDASNTSHGWIMRNGVFRQFDFNHAGTAASSLTLSGINNSGWITGSTNLFPDCTGFKQNIDTGEQVCISFQSATAGFVVVVPTAINNPGSVAGFEFLGGGDVGFTFDSTGFHPMEDVFAALNPIDMFVRGISDAGVVVGYTQGAAGPCAGTSFLANPDHTFSLFQVPGFCSNLRGISSSGEWMVGTAFIPNSSGGGNFVVRKNKSFDIGGNFIPFGINSSGVVVGYTILSNGSTIGVVGTPPGH